MPSTASNSTLHRTPTRAALSSECATLSRAAPVSVRPLDRPFQRWLHFFSRSSHPSTCLFNFASSEDAGRAIAIPGTPSVNSASSEQPSNAWSPLVSFYRWAWSCYSFRTCYVPLATHPHCSLSASPSVTSWRQHFPAILARLSGFSPPDPSQSRWGGRVHRWRPRAASALRDSRSTISDRGLCRYGRSHRAVHPRDRSRARPHPAHSRVLALRRLGAGHLARPRGGLTLRCTGLRPAACYYYFPFPAWSEAGELGTLAAG